VVPILPLVIRQISRMPAFDVRRWARVLELDVDGSLGQLEVLRAVW